MKKLQVLFSAFCLFFPTLSAQEMQQITVWKNGNILYNSNLSLTDSIRFSSFSVPNTPDGVLINGVVWACCNVDMPGTFVSQPNKAGMFYQWNRNIGWSSTNPMINSNGGTEWDSSMPIGDIWEQANNPCPTGWRLPTYDEQWNLLNSWNLWGELEGVAGRFFGTGDQKLFFPAAGLRESYDGWLYYVGYNGYYWSGESYTDYNYDYAYCIYFYNNSFYMSDIYRSNACSVRCVSE